MDVIVKTIKDKKYQKVLLVDKSVVFDINQLVELKNACTDHGFRTTIFNNDDMSIESTKLTSIVAHMYKSIECDIYFVDSCSKPLTIPKEFVVSKNRILIIVLHTRFKKQPYAKKLFDYVLTINDESENQHISMAKSMIKTEVDLGDVDVHDLNMLMLIFHQNVLKLKMPLGKLIALFKTLVTSEMFMCHEDAPITPLIQVSSLAQEFKGSKIRSMEFTQHLSKYSLQSAHKKKIIEKYFQAKDVVYEKLLLENSPIMKDLCGPFYDTLNKIIL